MSKKVLQIALNYKPNIGGLETHLEDLVKVSNDKKIDTFVLTYKPMTTLAHAKFYERVGLLKIIRLPLAGKLFYKLLKYPALEFLYLTPLLFIVTPIVIAIYKPNTIHAHGIITGFIGAIWAKVFQTKFIISTHSLYNFSGKDIYSKLAKYIFSSSDKVLCLSRQSVNELTLLGIDTGKLAQFNNWINTNVFKPSKTKGLKKETVVLFVGRLVEEKGVIELLKAAEKLKNSSIKFEIAGVGPLENLVQQAEKLNTNISYLGKIENANLPSVYSNADITVVPSTHEEGFGRVVIESLACGTPVAAVKRGGIVDILNENIGYFIETDENLMSSSIKDICDDAPCLSKKSSNARQFVLDNYSELQANDILKYY